MSALLAEDYHALLGRDLEPQVGMRVCLTFTARTWEVEKAMRGDSGGGGLGDVIEVREGGKVCSVRWETGAVQPYPTGVLERHYLALHPVILASELKKQQAGVTSTAMEVSEEAAQFCHQQQLSDTPRDNKKDIGEKRSSDSAPEAAKPSSEKKSKKGKDISVVVSSPASSAPNVPQAAGTVADNNNNAMAVDTPSSKRRKGNKLEQDSPLPTPKSAGGGASITLQFQGKWRPVALDSTSAPMKSSSQAGRSCSSGSATPVCRTPSSSNKVPHLSRRTSSTQAAAPQRSLGQVSSLLEVLVGLGGTLPQQIANGSFGSLAKTIASVCLADDGSFHTSALIGSGEGTQLRTMIGNAWHMLGDVVSEGVSAYDGSVTAAQWAALDAACVILCLLNCPSTDDLMQDSVVQACVQVIEQVLKQSQDQDAAHDVGGTPLKRKKSSAARTAASGIKSGAALTPSKKRTSKAGGADNEEAHRTMVTCCALRGLGALAYAHKLQEEQVQLARNIGLMAIETLSNQDVRTSGVALLKHVCTGYPAMRQDVVEELFVQVTSEAWLAEASAHGVLMQPSATTQAPIVVSALTACLVSIVQGAAARAGEAKASSKADNDSEAAASDATSLCTYFFALVGNRAVVKKGSAAKGKDTELRAMLEVLAEDLLRLLYDPAWPAAEVLLLAACSRFDWFLAGRSVTVSAAYKAIAVDLLGRIIEALTDQRTLDKERGSSLLGVTCEEDYASDDDALMRPLNGEHVVGAAVSKRFGKQMYAGTVTKYYAADGECGQDLFQVTYEDNDVEDLEWEALLDILRKDKASTAAHRKPPTSKGLRPDVMLRLQWLVLSFIQSCCTTDSDAINFYASELCWNLGERPAGASTEDAEVAYCASRRIGMSRTLAKGLGKRVQLLLGVLEQRGAELGAGSARMRQRAMQALTHIVKMDPSVLRGSHTLELVRTRYATDPSALVRSVALELLCHMASPARTLPQPDLDIVYARTRDVAPSVRLQAVTVLAKAIEWLREAPTTTHAGTPSKGFGQDAAGQACMHLCSMMADQDESVQKKVVKLLQALWFQGTCATQSVANEVVYVLGSSAHDDAMASTLVVLLRRVIGEQDGSKDEEETSEDKAAAWVSQGDGRQARQVCAYWCQAIIAEALQVQQGGKDASLSMEECSRLVALYTCLRRLGDAAPSLLLPHASDLVSVGLFPSPTTPQMPSGPEADAVTARRCRVISGVACVVKLVLCEGAVSREAASALQRHLAALANRVPEARALEAVMECLCACSHKHLAGGTVAAQLLARYVSFIGTFLSARKPENVRYVTTALLGAGAICQHLDFAEVLHNEEGIEACKKQQDSLVRLCVEHLAEDADERLRRCAFQCLGGLMVRSPALLLQKKVSALVASSLSASGDPIVQYAVLKALRIFLEDEDARISASSRTNKPKTGKEAVSTERVSSMSTSLANDFLPLILEAMFSSQDSADCEQGGRERQREAVRSEATSLVGVIVRRGLTAPQRVAPHLIALGAREDSTSATAGRVYDALVSKHRDIASPNVIIEGVLMACSRTRWTADADTPPIPTSSFSYAFKQISVRGAEVRALVKGLLKKAEHAHGGHQDYRRFVEFIAHTLANFPFATVDGPLTCIHTVSQQALLNGTAAIQGLHAILENEGQVDEVEVRQLCTKGMMVSILLALSKHLQSAYNLSDAKVRGYNHGKEGLSKADKAVADVMLPFRPQVIFADMYTSDVKHDTVLAQVSRLEKLMFQCHIEANETSGATTGVTPAKGVQESEASGGASAVEAQAIADAAP